MKSSLKLSDKNTQTFQKLLAERIQINFSANSNQEKIHVFLETVFDFEDIEISGVSNMEIKENILTWDASDEESDEGE